MIRWSWDWNIARPYLLLAGYGIVLKLAVILGWTLGGLWPIR